MELTLTPGLEDYLKAIIELQKEKKIVRVKDITSKLNVAPSSVINALKHLQKKGYIEHEKYGYIELTQRGIAEGERILKKYRILEGFFRDILKLPKEESYKNACSIEHYISSEAVERIIRLYELFNRCEDAKAILIKYEEYIIGKDPLPNECRTKLYSLNELDVGDRGRVVAFDTTPFIKKRLIDLGLVIGDEIEVLGIAPLGDPIEIKVKGVNISLRKEEAKGVLVEKL